MDLYLKEKCKKNKIYLQALQSNNTRNKYIQIILNENKIPLVGLDENTIETLIQYLSNLDSNNQIKNIGIGEREGRIFSSIVSKYSFRLSHGIGRSGDICELQPKALGSTILYNLSNKLALHVVNILGINGINSSLILPLATGMSLALCIRTLSTNRSNAKYVLWGRIDQKSAFKSILVCGFIPIIISTLINGDEITLDLNHLKESIIKYNPNNIVCIMSTTSSFSPRIPDPIVEISQICQQYQIPHLVNNAYGLQIPQYSSLLSQAINKYRVDLIVQSTDKNFMVPVGGAIICSPSKDTINQLSSLYAGRASIKPALDFLITILQMGQNTLNTLIKERQTNFTLLQNTLQQIANEFNLNLLSTPSNHISLALSLNNLLLKDKTFIGQSLFYKCITGCRVVQRGNNKTINGYEFINWGSHHNDYNHDYITFASSIGITNNDITKFHKRFLSILSNIKKSS